MTDSTPLQPIQLMSTDPDWMLLVRFLRGECSPEEAETIARWEAAEPGNTEVLALMRRAWDEAAVDVPEADEDAGWRAMQARIAAVSRPATVRQLRLLPDQAAGRRRRWIRALVAGAAAAMVAATAGTVVWRRNAVEEGVQPAREYATTRGQRAELMLVDGTRVWLSVDSRLRVPAGYGRDARDVELDGEAYFIVQADPKRPFRVHSRGAVSEDLGTEFAVRAYADEADVTVAVASGRVAVRSDATPAGAGRGVELGRGQLGRLDPAGRLTVTDDVDLAGILGWREGRLRFVERPLAEVVQELERWYDLEITLDDSLLAGVPVTASLGRRTADQALAIIAGVLDVRYTREDRQVRLSPMPVRP